MLFHVNGGSFVIFRNEGEDDVETLIQDKRSPALLDLDGTVLNGIKRGR